MKNILTPKLKVYYYFSQIIYHLNHTEMEYNAYIGTLNSNDFHFLMPVELVVRHDPGARHDPCDCHDTNYVAVGVSHYMQHGCRTKKSL